MFTEGVMSVRRVPPAGLKLIRNARQEFGYGAARTRPWLERGHGIPLAMGTIPAGVS